MTADNSSLAEASIERNRAAVSSVIFKATSSDVDEHSQKLGLWNLRYDQIGRGAFLGSYTQVRLPGLIVFSEWLSRHVRQSGSLGEQRFGLGLPWRSEGDMRMQGSRIDSRHAIACYDREFDLSTPETFEIRGIDICGERLSEIAGTLGIASPERHKGRVVPYLMEGAAFDRLKAVLAAIFDAAEALPTVFTDPCASREIEDGLLLTLLEILQGEGAAQDVKGRHRKRVVDDACDLMLADHDEAMSLLRICQALQISPRKLGYCFQETIGTSPAQYWRIARLNRVRRDLKALDDRQKGIFDIAVRHGFWHFGQFSLLYKRHFGETPTKTRRRTLTM